MMDSWLLPKGATVFPLNYGVTAAGGEALAWVTTATADKTQTVWYLGSGAYVYLMIQSYVALDKFLALSHYSVK